jgi:hypothetical protein
VFKRLAEMLKKKEIDPQIKKELKFEATDFLALMIAAITVIGPVILAIFAVIAVIILLLFYR